LGRNLNRDCPRAVLGLRSELGFTLIEILLVCAIIVILVSVGSASYLEAQRRAEEHRCAGRLQELALYEKMYAREFGDYALFWELQDQGYIDPHYIESDTPKHNTGIAFIPQYRLEFTVPGDGTYRIAASSDLTDPAQFHPRWRLTGGIWDLRAMYVDDRGIVRWVENNAPVYR
jgi:prepilin-type N-terminal cleavage/methylation domain-containing protein